MNWLKALGEVSSREALLAVVNEYLLSHPEQHWSWIPREARPRLVSSLEELQHWHHTLTAQVASATNPNIYMQDVCVFFVRAAARAVEIEQATRQGRLANDGRFDASGNGNRGG